MRLLSVLLAVLVAIAPAAARADLWINIDSPLIPVPGTRIPCPQARVITYYHKGKTTVVYDCTSDQGSFSLEANFYKYTDASKYRTCYFSYRHTKQPWELSVHSNKGCSFYWVNENTLDVY